jgi:prefoldin subunit 5
VRELVAEIERLQRQVTELQGANATLREALSRTKVRLVSILSRYGRRDLIDGTWR